EVYDITNNQITFATAMGQVGLEWTVAGFGDFSGNANETDMLMRDTSTGQLEVYDIRNNAITAAAAIGQVGAEWSVGGIAADAASGSAQIAQTMAAFSPSGAAPLAAGPSGTN